jgi:REP element-mobilizing transposase RayT
MPRKRYIPEPNLPFHIWGRANNKEWFGLPMDVTWEIFSNQLYFIHHAYNFRIHNFVLMSNHYHMNGRTPDANLAEAMNHFQGEVSREIGRATGRINSIFGCPYGRSLLRTSGHFLDSYKYTYRNPVEARMIGRVEDYRYSTLHGLIGRSQLIIPVEYDDALFSDIEGTLRWLNEDYPTHEYRDAMSRGLRRSEFKLPKKFENR